MSRGQELGMLKRMRKGAIKMASDGLFWTVSRDTHPSNLHMQQLCELCIIIARCTDEEAENKS